MSARSATLAASLGAVLAGAALLGPGAGRADAPGPRRGTTAPALAAASTPPAAASDPPAAASDPLAAACDRFAGAIEVRGLPGPAALLDEARAGRLAPLALRVRLEETLARRPGLAREAAEALLGFAPGDAPWALGWALALAGRLDAAGADTLLAGLERAPAAARPFALLALRGDATPRAARAFARLYAEDADPEVRQNAALALAERGERLEPALRAAAQARARADLLGADAAAWDPAADLLGVPPLGPADRALLERLLLDPARRLPALRALASAGVGPDELAPLLERAAR